MSLDIPNISYNKNRLLTPGPVPLSSEVLKILSQPLLHHRTKEFTNTLKEVLDDLPLVFETRQPVFIQTAVGTGLMESALVNTLSPKDHVLVVNAGKFGERWTKMAKALELQVQEIKVPWGQSVDPEIVRDHLSRDTKAILVQASETSTGALHPIHELAQITENTDTLLIVDAITALAVVDIPMDKWGLDVVIGGAQKAFMLPPGIGFISLSEKAWKANQESSFPKFYWDIQAELKANQKGQTHFTSAITHIRALHWVLKNKLNKEYSKKYCQQIAKTLSVALPRLGFEIFPQVPSPALTAFTLKEQINSSGQMIGANAIKSYLQDRCNITIAGGQDHLSDKLLRIGHMGDIQDEDILAVVKALGEALQHLGLPSDPQKALLKALEVLNQ